jgi:hypothetical protein
MNLRESNCEAVKWMKKFHTVQNYWVFGPFPSSGIVPSFLPSFVPSFLHSFVPSFLSSSVTAQGELWPPEKSASILLYSLSVLPILSLSFCEGHHAYIRYSGKQKIRRFGNWICFRPQVRGKDTYSVGSFKKS